MASKKRQEPNVNQAGMFSAPSVPIAPAAPAPMPAHAATVIGDSHPAIDLDTFDDYHDSFERIEEEDPAPVVTVVKKDKRGLNAFEVVLKRDKYGVTSFCLTHAELVELGVRIEGALK